MTHDLADLMLRATTDLHNPDAPGQVIRRVQRRRRQRSQFLAVTVSVIVAAAAIAIPLATSNGAAGGNIASLKPAAIPATTAPDYLAGPTPPANAHHLLGRAYVVDHLSVDGRSREVVVYWTDEQLDPDTRSVYRGPQQPGPILCAALWEPGTPLASAYPMQCTGLGTPAPPASTALFYWAAGTNTNPDPYHPRDGSFPAAFPNVDLLLVNKKAAHVELLIDRYSDLAKTASPDGGHPPVRKSLTVNVVGNDQPTAMTAFAVAPKLPAGEVYVGENIIDAQGKTLLHEVSGWYCGPDGKGTKDVLPCPATPSASPSH